MTEKLSEMTPDDFAAAVEYASHALGQWARDELAAGFGVPQVVAKMKAAIRQVEGEAAR